MRLIVDSNIFFSLLIKDSITRKIFTHLDAEFLVIPLTFDEINRYKNEIMEKGKISEETVYSLLNQTFNRCTFIEDETLLPCWEEAKKIMDPVDPNDTPFIAAALALCVEIWSDDAHFMKQKKIKVWRTRELAKRL